MVCQSPRTKEQHIPLVRFFFGRSFGRGDRKKSLTNYKQQTIHMKTIKAKINSFINYAENNTIKVLPTLQDIRNIKEYAIVGSRQVQIVLLNHRINRLNIKLHKLDKKKWELVDKNIEPLFATIEMRDM